MKHLVKSFCILIFLYATSSSAGSSATAGDNGVGIAVGDFGGVTFFHRFDEQSFVQGYISSHFLIGADYAVSLPKLIPSAPMLVPYVGGGAFLFSTRYWSTYDDHGHRLSGIGAKLPLGMMVKIPDAPIHIYAEISPASTLIPFVESFLTVQVGTRFLF